jgi:hypothetical protein
MADEPAPVKLAPEAKGTVPLFVAGGAFGQRIVSEDGANWKNLQLGKEGEIYRAAACGNGRYVVVGSYGGDNLFAASADGIAWQVSKKDARYPMYLRGMIFANGLFWGVGGDPGAVGDSRPFVATSADGVAWGDPLPISGKNMVRRIAFGNGLFVGVGDRGRRAYSKDGKEWLDVPDVKATDTLVDVAFGKNIFVGVGLHGLRMTSEDGVKWSPRMNGEEGEHLNSVVWAGDRFVAVGMGATWVSPDGAKWERQPNDDAPTAVAYGKGVFVGAKWKGRIMRSSDGVKWEQAHRCENDIASVGFGV